MRSLRSPISLKPLLSACKHKSPVSQIHAFVIATGLSASLGRLIASYVQVGDIMSARHLFDKAPQRGIEMWNSMIIAYSRANYPDEVLNLYRQIITRGIRPDSTTFTVALKACSSLMDLEAGEEIWRRAVDFGYEGDVFVGGSVLNLYAKCGKMNEAMFVFDKMAKKDVVCWTTMITGFAQSGKALEAISIYRRMQGERIEGDEVVMVGLIQACALLGDSKLGLSVHGYMVRRELDVNHIVLQTSLVDMYAKNGHLELASRLFKEMPYKNVVSWAALISGFAQNGFAGKVLELLVKMQSSGFTPDLVSIVSALLACSQVGYLKLGKSIHGYIVRRLPLERVSGTALIDMYAKCGSLSCARALFDQIDSRDLILWNAMIASYGIHGHGEEALLLFLKMGETNIKPDHATFASLLSACSHSGLVKEGQYWFDIMVNEFKIQPKEKHYACMVDLLSRAGQVEEAYRLIKTMNTKPGLAIWVTLLSGCHTYGKFSIGEKAVEKILDSNLDDLGIYVLVSNFFSKARKWDHVATLRKMVKTTGMSKVPGYSAVEVDGNLQAFLMEDKNHNQYKNILPILECLDNEMRFMRHVTGTEYILQDLEENVYLLPG